MNFILTIKVLFMLSYISVESMNVYYSIVVKHVIYNPDGYPLPVIGVYLAGQEFGIPFPGPLIRATIGDTLHLTVKNELIERTSIHFHGIHMENNVWMDGVMDITECGIAPETSFTYSFALTQTGTYWYHSHSAVQFGDGLFGPLVIDYPKGDDPVFQKFMYNKEYIVTLQDWIHEVGNDVLLYYRGPYEAYPGFKPKYPWPPHSFLINGTGNTSCTWNDCSYDSSKNSGQCYPSRPPLFGTCNSAARLPLRFECPKGENVRMRIINAGANLPSRFWIDRHDMIIVEKDGMAIEPLSVDHVVIAVAQRIDVILRCDQDPSFNYYIYSTIPSTFIPDLENLPMVFAYALLTYSNSTQQNKTAKVHPEYIHKNSNESLFFEYKLKPKEPINFPPATKRIFLFQDVVYNLTKGHLEDWTINNITFKESTKPFLPAKYSDENLIIQNITGENGNIVTTHIEKVTYGEVVEVVLISYDKQQHPWHLHGQWVYFVKAGCLTGAVSINCSNVADTKDRLIAKAESFLTPYNQAANVIATGDSFTVPGYGYVAFRFNASNPGPWFLHCHVEWHLGLGMALIISVEQTGGTQYPNIGDIPENMIPQCAPYLKFKTKTTNEINGVNGWMIWGILSIILCCFFIIGIVLNLF